MGALLEMKLLNVQTVVFLLKLKKKEKSTKKKSFPASMNQEKLGY